MSKESVKGSFLQFIGKLSVLTMVLVLIYVVTVRLFLEEAPSRPFPVFLVLFVVTAAVHYLLLVGGAIGGQKLVLSVLLSVVSKLIIYVIFAVFLILNDRSGAVGNVILFFLGYITYTVFELSVLFAQARRSA